MEKPNDGNNDCKMCSKCKQSRPLDWFEAKTKLCIQCLGHQRAYRQRHKEKISNYNKIYYQEHKEQCLENCKCLVSNRNIALHIKTNKHINNMENFIKLTMK